MPPRRSPPKHRHDGTSPLPLGMDWSPPPKKWDGGEIVWPHDPRTGWSYCVTIPSWSFQPEPGVSEDSFVNPIVFYRVQIGLQSPEGITTKCIVRRRFSDFLKFYAELKKAFPKKNIPQPPPKHSFLRINSSHALLEERRYSLEEWLGKLLSDIDLSRSVHVASFLELEAAARSSFVESSQQGSELNRNGNSGAKHSSVQIAASCGSSVAGSSLAASAVHSMESDYSSDNAYDSMGQIPGHGVHHTSEPEPCSPSRNHTECSLSNLENGMLTTESSWQLTDGFSGGKRYSGKNKFYENASGADTLNELSEMEHDKHPSHARKLSADSFSSDISSVRGSEISSPYVHNILGEAAVDLPGREESGDVDTFCNNGPHISSDALILLPLDQRNKLNRLLVTMQRRLMTSKTDMEDLIARLNQEMAVKDYLTTKVKDLELELENTKQRSKENLQQAILSERERVTQMQWDMDELRRKTLEMESKLKHDQNARIDMDSDRSITDSKKEALLQELEAKNAQLEISQKHIADLELKSKSDIKVLGKEIKSLRNSQSELKEMLQITLNEKSELQRVLQKEKERWGVVLLSRKKLLHECDVLRQRLDECNIDVLSEEEEDFTINSSSIPEALNLLSTSDNRIGLLLAEAQLLAQEDDTPISDAEINQGSEFEDQITTISSGDVNAVDGSARKMITDMLIDNALLRRQINSITRFALRSDVIPEKEEEHPTTTKSVLNSYSER